MFLNPVSFSLLSVLVIAANSYRTGLSFNNETITLEESMTLLTSHWKIHHSVALLTDFTELPANI